jgi:RimJ/RimL family protein N-acetyltransferase
MADLVAIEFRKDHLDLFRDFDCGQEPYERELAEWIRQESTIALSQGTKVWIYATSDKAIIGYGSLGVTRWNYPSPSAKRIALAIIPSLAIHRQYWGKPEGPREKRYSSQILDHLITEASFLPLKVPMLGLFVHPENLRAIKAYERANFRQFSQTSVDKVTGVTYCSMIRPLALSSGPRARQD